MSKLSKLIKKATKNPVVKGVVKVAKDAFLNKNPKLGQTITKGAQVLKGAGISPVKPVKLPTNVQVLVAKSMPALPAKNSARTAMPGGAPISGTSSSKRAKPASLAKAKKAAKPKKAAPAKKSAKKGGSIGGKGSLDLKATSAKWKKAGKPGKWIDYVKAHGVKRK